jgi:lipoprotein-anchoring transpeptidase ErfK/SrfK
VITAIGAIVLILVLGAAGYRLAAPASSRGARLAPSALARAAGDAARAKYADALAAERAALQRGLAISPEAGAVDVSPVAPIVVAAGAGRLVAVHVTGPDGRPVETKATTSPTRWQADGMLSFDATYRVTATAVGPSGVAATATSTFSTVTPVSRVHATVWPDTGMSVGVGQPIVLHFDAPITSDAARAGVLSHITVAATRPVPGGWHWFSARELHFRPRQLWPAGEQIAVTTDLAGWDAGAGRWGEGSVSVRFAVGDSRVSVADLSTHLMTVRENGRVIATYPFSGGRDKYPTMNGIHVVLDRETLVHMVSSTNGIPVDSPDGYDEWVFFDVHITDSGEYVHAAPWSVSSQGHANVSHGCINLSLTDAKTFFDFSRVGDVLEVVGGPRPPAAGDHGVMDWSTPDSAWTPATVQPLAAAG